MRQPLRQGTVLALVASTWVAAVGLVRAQDEKTKPDRPQGLLKGSNKAEKVSGVIVKVEESALAESRSANEGADKQGGRSPRGKRLTINTAAVWLDWARDQGSATPGESPKEAAEKGDNSIATKGQPKSADTLVTVDLPADSKIETRFRSVLDEGGQGAKTPEGAAEAVKDPADTSKRDPDASAKGGDRRATPFDLANLKPGLFVDVEFRHETGKNRALQVIVLRPVGRPEAPAPGPSAVPKDRK